MASCVWCAPVAPALSSAASRADKSRQACGLSSRAGSALSPWAPLKRLHLTAPRMQSLISRAANCTEKSFTEISSSHMEEPLLEDHCTWTLCEEALVDWLVKPALAAVFIGCLFGSTPAEASAAPAAGRTGGSAFGASRARRPPPPSPAVVAPPPVIVPPPVVVAPVVPIVPIIPVPPIIPILPPPIFVPPPPPPPPTVVIVTPPEAPALVSPPPGLQTAAQAVVVVEAR